MSTTLAIDKNPYLATQYPHGSDKKIDDFKAQMDVRGRRHEENRRFLYMSCALTPRRV
jgi:hypothetical protein